MNEELIAKKIKKEILIDNFKRYFDILKSSSNKEPFKDKYWNKAQKLYNSLDNENKENLEEFTKMIMIESVSEVLGLVDGTATFEEQEHFFEISYNNSKISGSLQEYLLMDIEDNGFNND